MINKSRPLWLSDVTLFAIVSALLLACEKAVDSIVSNKFLDKVDPITAASSYIFVGGWFGVIVVFLLAFVFGNVLRRVKPINLNQPKMYKPAILAGVAAAGSTFAFLFGLQIVDLQLMYALTSSYLLFVIIMEGLSGKIQLKSFIIPGLMVVLGSVIAVYDPLMFSSKQVIEPAIFVVVCIVVFVAYNALFATDELLHKPAVAAADPMNVQILRFITLAITASIGVLLVAILRGTLPLLIEACLHLIGNPDARFWLFSLFLIATVGMLSRLIAKDKSNNVSKVVIVVAGNLAVGLFLSLLLDKLWPGAAGRIPNSGDVLLIRVVGSGIIAAGILILLRRYSDNNEFS